jgi:hypothetical protein
MTGAHALSQKISVMPNGTTQETFMWCYAHFFRNASVVLKNDVSTFSSSPATLKEWWEVCNLTADARTLLLSVHESCVRSHRSRVFSWLTPLPGVPSSSAPAAGHLKNVFKIVLSVQATGYNMGWD